MSCFPTQMWTVSGVRVFIFIKVVSVCGGGFSLGSSWSDSLAQHLVFDIRFVNVLKTKCCTCIFVLRVLLLYVLLLLEIGDYYCSILCGVVCVIVYVIWVLCFVLVCCCTCADNKFLAKHNHRITYRNWSKYTRSTSEKLNLI